MPWTQNLSVGVAIIDDQHKKLFEMADQLFEAGRNHKGKEQVGDMLRFLDAYTKKHFSEEEAYMLSIGYRDLAVQKKAHSDFMQQLASLKKEYEETGGSIAVIINANQMVVNWLISHISVQDKKIGEYSKNNKK